MNLIYILAGIVIVLFIIAVLFAIVLGNKEKKDIPLPYKAKKYFFTKTEQEFVRILNESIDRQKFTIFPKVRLADIVEVTATGTEYQAPWNRIKSKHVDFLVWNVQEGKVALVIELDGKSHCSEKMIERDDFVNRLYGQVGIKLVRVSVGTDFKQEVGKILDGLSST